MSNRALQIERSEAPLIVSAILPTQAFQVDRTSVKPAPQACLDCEYGLCRMLDPRPGCRHEAFLQLYTD